MVDWNLPSSVVSSDIALLCLFLLHQYVPKHYKSQFKTEREDRQWGISEKRDMWNLEISGNDTFKF